MEQNNKKTFGQIISNFSMPILLGLLILVFSILSDRFLTPLNLTNILVQNVHIAICATGVFMIMVILKGHRIRFLAKLRKILELYN